MKKINEGYTLIELVIVIAMIGLLIAFTAPKFQQAILSNDIKGVVRHIVGTIKTLRSEAVFEQEDYTIIFDLSDGEIWIISPDLTEEEKALAHRDSYELPDDVHIKEIAFKDSEDKIMGEVSIRISRKGYIQPAIIHIESDSDEEFSLILRPFLGKVEVINEIVDYDDF